MEYINFLMMCMRIVAGLIAIDLGAIVYADCRNSDNKEVKEISFFILSLGNLLGILFIINSGIINY